METKYCTGCIDRRTGNTGAFIIEPGSPPGAYRALSPVFDSLAELYPWMRQNNWILIDGTPWGCRKEEG